MRYPIRLLIAPLLLCSAVAHAELGAAVSNPDNSAGSEAPRINTTLRAQATANNDAGAGYTRHETTTEIGTVIREYADSHGTVFAVSWEGPVKPDLQALLGHYFPQLLDAAAQPGRGPVQINSPELVIFSGGRPRAFFGRAYLPALVPGGVNIDVLP
jgi:hypothetical protein